jgi:hypothetical protein
MTCKVAADVELWSPFRNWPGGVEEIHKTCHDDRCVCGVTNRGLQDRRYILSHIVGLEVGRAIVVMLKICVSRDVTSCLWASRSCSGSSTPVLTDLTGHSH